MSDQHKSDPGHPERGFDPVALRPHSPLVGYGSPTSVPQESRRSSGPPSIPPSGEQYLRNYGHLPGNAPQGLPPGWNRPAPLEDLYHPMTPQAGMLGVSRGVESPLPSGYDYHFVPPLDPKYECPICLMCLRDPVQTECGHRFCAACIKQCLRDAGLRCPVDNVPLTENQMFPDLCVKREILDLQARCPFTDCPELIELRTIESHEEGCSFRTEPCPNKCGASMRRKSVDHHLESECTKRLVECGFCSIQLPFDKREDHMGACPRRSVSCEFCHQSVISQDLYNHHRRQCSAVPVPCQFAQFGCQERLPKEQMAVHEKEAMGRHIELLGAHLARPIHSTDRSITGDLPEQGWRTGATYNGRSEFVTVGNERSEYATAAGKMTDVGEYGMKRPNVEMLGRTQMGKAATLVTSPTHLPSYGSMGSMPFVDPWEQVRGLKEKVKELQEREVWMRQKIIEFESKNKSKDSEIKSLRDRVEYLQKDVKDVREHVANGIFVWRLHGYSELRRAAERGEPTVRHSDGFYTGSCGYRLCIRVNINKSDNRNTTYISLFVHFMQGKYDDFLEWPFRGSIKLSIIDQNDESDGERKNVSEVLHAKSSLDAFKRPKTVRNHKGFGYMEFASVESLELEGRFIKEEMILIKVEVNPQT